MMDRFEAAAKAGFKGVEFHFPYRWPARELADRNAGQGLQQVQINAPAGDWEAGERGLAGLPGRDEEFRDSIGLAIDYASALGCPLVHVMAGVLPGDIGRERAMETFADNLYFAATACAEEGIGVLIEPLNAQDVPGYLIGHTVQAKLVIDVVGHDNLFMQYDIYHGAMNGEDLLAAIEENLDRIRHMQVAGAPGRHEPEDGDIDYGALFETIDGLGYGGWIGCEYRPRAGTVEGLGWASAYGIG